jgi:RND superfamily putative drug exporter
MATALYRLGRLSVRNRGKVVLTWIVLLLAVGAAAIAFRGPTSSDFNIPGTEAQSGLDTLAEQFPAASGATATVVVQAPEGSTLQDADVREAVLATTKEANELPQAVAALDPYSTKSISPDGRTGLVTVQFDEQADGLTDETRDALEGFGQTAEDSGLRVEIGGEAMMAEPEIVGATEVIGVGVAVLVLLITFGSLVAAGMPLVTALVGVGVGLAGVTALSGTIAMNSTAPVLALMLGLAVGIDYALFIVSRHREQLADSADRSTEAVESSIARAVGTAGSAVLFAGTTVVIALAGLSVVGIKFLTVMGLAAAATVAVAVLVAITLLPAILGYAGVRVLPRRLRHDASAPLARVSMGTRWAGFTTRFRVPVIIGGLLVVGAMAIPTTDMRLALPDDGTAPVESTKRQAYDLVADSFGEGANGRLLVVVSADEAKQAAGVIAADLQETDGVAAVAGLQVNEAGDTAILPVVPTAGPSDVETEQLVHDIRAAAPDWEDSTDSSIDVTGSTAIGIDVSDKLADALPVYLLVVVGLSFILLAAVFRSVLVPLKATLGFLLSVGASFGATVAVFQWGWLSGLLGVESTGPLISFLPILLIGILFGLAMDYEVFLVSRMREEHVHGADAQEAVRHGMTEGARVVTAAAVIMISVFGGFAFASDPTIKSMGFALAVGVAVDAFIVRMTVVPAVMSLLGEKAWWLPGWLDRILPNVDVEGSGLRDHEQESRREVPTGA